MGLYIFPSGYFLPLSGGTVSGLTVYTAGLSANTLSATTIYSGTTDLSLILANIFSGQTVSGNFLPTSGGTGGQYFFTGTTTAETVSITTSMYPEVDNIVDIGTPIRRFRNLNTVNGVTVGFTATTLQLGGKLVTEHSIILTGDTIFGGNY